MSHDVGKNEKRNALFLGSFAYIVKSTFACMYVHTNLISSDKRFSEEL